jgi:hypothetical protein
MKYKIQKLDGRHSYHHLFQYYIGFSKSMWQDQGPLDFSESHLWFLKTYGWSAEVPVYIEILEWYNIKQYAMFRSVSSRPYPLVDSKIPELCNPYWSWTNGIGDQYRIYVASDVELTFFCLSLPLDQK